MSHLFKAIALLALGLFPVHAQPVEAAFLSDYLGVPSGSAAYLPNPPFVTTLTHPGWGIGADTAGAWAGANEIHLHDVGFYGKGIGSHPPSTVTFDLAAIAGTLPFVPQKFYAEIGIDPSGGGADGAVFEVYLDGVLVTSQTIQDVNSPFMVVDVPLAGATTLTLTTSVYGAFWGNHAVWADARLSATDSCPTIHVVQPGGPGTMAVFTNDNLVAGRSYLNLFSPDLCPVVGSGFIGGLCFSPMNLPLLFAEIAGPAPFNVTAPGPTYQFTSAVVPITFECICGDITGGVIRSISPAMRLTIQ